VVKRSLLTICPQPPHPKSRKALRNFAPSRCGFASLLPHGSGSRKKSSVCRFVETWLIQPLLAPTFQLPDLAGDTKQLHSFRGNLVLFIFGHAAPSCAANCGFSRSIGQIGPRATFAFSVSNLDDPSGRRNGRSFATKEGISLPILLATQEVQASTTSSTAICSTAGEISRSQLLSCSTGTP